MSTTAHIQTYLLENNLSDIIRDTPIFDNHEEEREFWLAHLNQLDKKTESELFSILSDAEGKINEAQEEYFQKVNQISAIYLSKLKLVTHKKKEELLKISASHNLAQEEMLVSELENDWE